MNAVGQYFLSVIAAATIFSFSVSLIGNKGMIASVIKMTTGLFLAITVISPIIHIKIPDITEFLSSVETNASAYVSQGEADTNAEVISLIKEKTQAYILDEATKLGANISVDIEISDGSPPKPMFATIQGTVSPYTKQQLSQIITDDLGIAKEKQLWR